MSFFLNSRYAKNVSKLVKKFVAIRIIFDLIIFMRLFSILFLSLFLFAEIICPKCQFKGNSSSDKYCLNCLQTINPEREQNNNFKNKRTNKKFLRKKAKYNKIKGNLKSKDPVARAKGILDILQNKSYSQGNIKQLINMVNDRQKISVDSYLMSEFDASLITSNITSIGSYAFTTLCQIGKPVFNPLLTKIKKTKTSDHGFKNRLMQLLIKMKDPRAFDFMIRSFNQSKNYSFSLMTAKYFKETKDKKCIPLLLKDIKKQDDRKTVLICDIFTVMPDKTMLPVMTRLLKDKNYRVVNAALKVLGKIQDPSILPGVLFLLKDKNTRQDALYVLYNCGDLSSLPIYANLLKNKDTQIRKKALLSILKFKGSSILPYVLPVLQRNDTDNKIYVLTALSDIKSEKIKVALIDRAKNDKSSVIRKLSVKYLRAYLDDEVLDIIIDIMNSDSDKVVRREAASVVSNSHNRKGLEAIKLALHSDPDPIFKQNAKTFIRYMEEQIDIQVNLAKKTG